MTAEVAIINSNAVAIAADSAVTIGQGKKIYNSAIKVFALSKIQPISIMVYGNAGLLGVPWETIIKIYRSELGDISFNTLEEYAKHFLSYLSKQDRFFTEAVQESWILGNIKGYYEAIRETYFSDVQAEFKKSGSVDEAQTIELFKNCVKSHHDRLGGLKYVEGITKSDEKRIRDKYQDRSKEIIKEVFQNVKPDRSTTTKLLNISAYIHTREIFSDAVSGVVIAGFGLDDIYPSVCTHEIEGVIEGKLKYIYLDRKSYRIKSGADCSIIAFAQDDMVASFVEGINPSVSRFIVHYLEQLFNRLPELIDEGEMAGDSKKKKEVKIRLKEDADKLLSAFLQQINIHKRMKHIDPILSMVQVLPKDELAAMAESLVNLTAFKRRMTDSLETVGGPVDVAVISKGDGLVWVKRKHYFPKELNQHFFANYFREQTCPSGETKRQGGTNE